MNTFILPVAYNPYHIIRANLDALRIALDEKMPSPEELRLLQQYSGFGGIKAILYPEGPKEEWIKLGASKDDLKLYDDIQSLHQLLKEKLSSETYERSIASLRNSVLTAFYTPAFLPRTIYEVLNREGIAPRHLFEPSAGAGIFISEAVKEFKTLEKVTAVEKDWLTAKVLHAVSKGWPVNARIIAKGLEETNFPRDANFDLVISNIPFGNFKVADSNYSDGVISNRIHNYFFAKSIDSTADGGLMAFITTDAFLNSPSNKAAREYLFERSDFISLAVMPDNLMKDTGGTEAPNQLLIVQKNENKKELSSQEQVLINTTEQSNEFGSYHVNQYLVDHPEIICADEIKPGQNQYGKANQQVWQNGELSAIKEQLALTIREGLDTRFNRQAFEKIHEEEIKVKQGHEFTFLPNPPDKAGGGGMQLGLFDTGTTNNNRAAAYISPGDEQKILFHTAKVLATIRPEHDPAHESIMLLSARLKTNPFYVYKLYSNLKEVPVSISWLNAGALNTELERLSTQLKDSRYKFRYEGDKQLEAGFGLKTKEEIFQGLQPHYREGTLVTQAGRPGTINTLDAEQDQAFFQSLAVKNKTPGFFRQYIKVRDDYYALIEKENATGVAQAVLRESLNESYKRFVSTHGQLNASANRNALLEDSLGFITLSSLERKAGDRYEKADIFTQPLFKNAEAFTTENPVEALAHSLNEKGCVDVRFIAETTGNTEEETIAALAEHIYVNPVNREWETADQYLSGNVVEKLKEAQTAVEQDENNAELHRSLAAIQRVQPERVPFELLDFNMGERWIPETYYQQFATHLFDVPTTVNYLSSVDAFKVAPRHNNARINEEFAVTPKNGQKMYGYTTMEHALENTAPFFTYEVQVGDTKIRKPDNEATQLAHQKIESMRAKFVEWLQDLPAADKKRLEQLYNDTFNCYVLREYSGKHLSFPGLDKRALGIADLYDSQKNAAWRIIQNRGAIIDHEVGLGKTLTMIVAAHEMKRLNILHKPCILALKANVAQIADTYRKAYPSARVLCPGKEDFTPAKRQQLFHAIKNNNWDCIILTHDQFGKIPQSPGIQKQILEQELENVSQDLQTLKELGGEISKKMMKGLEIRKNNLGAHLKDVLHKIETKKDTDINFRDLRIDHLFVDEAHKYKNLTFTTRHNRVAGLGNTEGSQKALNMLFAIRELQSKFNSDLCATFLSGTPISNSLTEMYLLFKYLRPKEMERQRIENFDGWAAVFAKKTTDFEFSVTNEIIAKERFRHFIKVPELALFYNEITDYKTARHIQLDKPQLKEELVSIKPTEEQTEFIRNLMTFARTGDATLIGHHKLSADEDKGRMLIATNYAKKMAVDMRLVNPHNYDDHPGNKVSICARKVAEHYKESTPHRGTQIVFADIGTPKPGEFNIYDALKEKLVQEYNIPAGQITFIHDWSDTKKPELFKKMNAGQIRVLIGSTEKAGTGLNVQERVIAMHHIDIPWKPSELEQRNGRGARQGNRIAKESYNNEVKGYIYAVEQSLDNYKFNLLKNKQTFISQMKNCELNVRSIDEGALDEKSGMNFSEYIAILSGDTTLLEKSKLEKKVAVLESLRAVHHKEVAKARYRLEDAQYETGRQSAIVDQLSRDENVYSKQLQHDKEGNKVNPVQLSGFSSIDAEKIGNKIIDLYKNWKPKQRDDTDELVGSLYGFNCFIRQQKESIESKGIFQYRYHNAFYVQHKDGGVKYTYNQGHPSVDNPKLAARHFLYALDRVSKLKETHTKELRQLQANIPVLEKMIARPFEKEDELKSMKTELSHIEREISLKIQETKLTDKEAPVIELNAETEDNQPKKTRSMRI